MSATLHVYSFHHWDEGYETYPEAPATLETAQVAAALLQAGWEGDGMIRLVTVPPFLIDAETNSSERLWHVKQSNNGTSWIVSVLPLHTHRHLVSEGVAEVETLLPQRASA